MAWAEFLANAARVKIKYESLGAAAGFFQYFVRALQQLINPDYQEAANIEDYFEPWERHCSHYGAGFETGDVCCDACGNYRNLLERTLFRRTDRASMLASLRFACRISMK